MTADPRVLVLEELRKQTRLLGAILLALNERRTITPDSVKKEPAADAVISGPYGDPVVRQKDPRDWTGEPMKGRKFSECSPEYLDMLAERFDYFASQETDEKKQKYTVLDARRARAWAAKLRGGWKPAERVDETQGEPTW